MIPPRCLEPAPPHIRFPHVNMPAPQTELLDPVEVCRRAEVEEGEEGKKGREVHFEVMAMPDRAKLSVVY